MNDIKEDILKKYIYRIKTLESSIVSFHKNDSKHKGYIINLNDYNNLKEKIQYKKNSKMNLVSKFDIFNIKENEKIMIIKDIDFKTGQYLTNMLLNGNKYIIIDGTFWKVICDKGKENSTVINYEISGYTALLKVKLNDKTLEFFNQKNNILEESKLKNKSENNFNVIKRAYQNVKSYYDFEIKIKNDIKVKKENIITGKGYLIEKDWINKWKQKIKYEDIKADYFNLNKTDKEIRDKLIYIFEENKYQLIDLTEIKNKELKNKEKIEECLQKDSVALVNSDFIKSFEQTHSLSEINYKLYEDTIEIDLGPNNSLKFKSSDNIIPQISGDSGNEEVNNSQDSQKNQNNAPSSKTLDNKFAKDILTILLNFKLGETELLDKVENSKSNINDSVNDYYLINSDTFSQFIQFFSFQKIDDIINYYNLKSISDIKDDLLEKISKENKVDFDKISKLKEDFFKKFETKKFFDIKSNEYGKVNDFKKYTYPSEFLIVSKNLKEKLCEIFGDKNYKDIEEISLGYVTGHIILKPKIGKFYDSIKFFAYIFSLSKEENGIIKFTPEILISFDKKISMINNFLKLIKDEALIELCISNIAFINTTYDCHAVLITKEKTKLFTKSKTNSIKVNTLENQNKENKYISISIKLNEEYSKFEKLTKEKNNNIEKDCYLIKKNFMEQLEGILCFDEIDNFINNNKQLTTEKKLDKIIKQINPETKKKLCELKYQKRILRLFQEMQEQI